MPWTITSNRALEHGKILRHSSTAIPKIFLHESYTSKIRTNLSILINRLFKSKDLERVKGIEPSSSAWEAFAIPNFSIFYQ
jgi:hypothetical protein